MAQCFLFYSYLSRESLCLDLGGSVCSVVFARICAGRGCVCQYVGHPFLLYWFVYVLGEDVFFNSIKDPLIALFYL